MRGIMWNSRSTAHTAVAERSDVLPVGDSKKYRAVLSPDSVS